MIGGDSLQKVYFENDTEFMYCCEALFQYNKTIHVTWEKDNLWGNAMVVERNEVDMKAWIHCFVMVYMTFRLGKKIKEVAKSVYYYSNETELNYIYDTTTAILKESYFKKAIFPKNETLYTIAFSLFEHHLKHMKQVHYDALVLFCMKPLDEYVIKAVGYGIDEMKREESHLQFIARAREFVLRRQDVNEELYLVHKDGLHIYRADGTVYSRQELMEQMQRIPLYAIQLDIDEHYLSPVIALAPKKIYLYTDRPIEGKTHTLCRIFQENIQLYPLNHFPFSLKVN